MKTVTCYDFRVKIGICSIIGAVCLGLIIRKIYLKKKQERNERKLKNDLEKSRKERRSKARQNDIPVEQRCVVCIHNPREVNQLKILIILELHSDYYLILDYTLSLWPCMPL